MQFGYIIVYVPDVESTMTFYKKAFNLKEHFLHESKQYGELNTGNTKIAFASNSLAQSNGVSFIENDTRNMAPGIEIALITNDVKQAYQHAIDNGATIVKAPNIKPWGQEVAYLRDINGIIVELCSPIG